MATYSNINNLKFDANFKGTKISKEEWENLVNKMLRMTFLTSVIDFEPKFNKSGYVTKVNADYSGESDSALDLPYDMRDMKRFLDSHGVKYTLEFDVITGRTAEINRFRISDKDPDVMISTCEVVLKDFVPVAEVDTENIPEYGSTLYDFDIPSKPYSPGPSA
jgi:hypothetical protein